MKYSGGSEGRLEKVLFDVAGGIRVVAMCSWRSESVSRWLGEMAASGK